METLTKVLWFVWVALSRFLDPAVNKTTFDKTGTLTTILTVLSLLAWVGYSALTGIPLTGPTSQDARQGVVEYVGGRVDVFGGLDVTTVSLDGLRVVDAGGAESVDGL